MVISTWITLNHSPYTDRYFLYLFYMLEVERQTRSLAPWGGEKAKGSLGGGGGAYLAQSTDSLCGWVYGNSSIHHIYYALHYLDIAETIATYNLCSCFSLLIINK